MHRRAIFMGIQAGMARVDAIRRNEGVNPAPQ